MEMCQRILFLLLFIRGFDCLYDEGPTFLEEPPPKIEFINELGVRLNCSASGRPQPSVRWTGSDGAGVTEVPGLRYFSTSDGSLVFPPFSAEAFRPDVHSSTYRCIASNSVGTIVSRDVTLRAVVKESFIARVENQRGTLGLPTILDCVTTPKHMKDYVVVTSWVRDKSLNILPGSLESDTKYHILRDGRLLIWQVEGKDAHSSYQCRLLHRLTGHTTVSEPGNLFVLSKDSSTSPPSRPSMQFRMPSLIVKENERVVLPCISAGNPPPSIRWLRKEGSRLSPVIDESSLEGGKGSSGLIFRHGALLLPSVKVEQKGVYLCNASNSEGHDFQEVELIVRSPLTLSIHPEKLTVDLGKAAEFSCQASGEPSPGPVTWLKDGNTLRPGRVRFLSQNRIVLSGVAREDQGIYQCIAKNDYETVQKAAHLRLGDAYPQLTYKFIEQTLQPGPAISLKCSGSGNPTPSVTWLLDGFPLPKSERFLIGQYTNVYGGDTISHVNITSVRVEDGGEYSCAFENRAGTATHAARLNIYGPPFVRVMPEILATAGQRLIIKCPVGGYPLDVVEWFTADGQKLPTNDRQSISSNGTLKLEPVERGDEVQLTCSAENKQGSTSRRSVSVRVMVPPRITPFTFPPDLHEGDRVSIQCVVVKGDPPLTMTWLKDTQALSHHPSHTNLHKIHHGHDHEHDHDHNHVTIRQLDQFTSVLSISSLDASHSGNWTCLTKQTNNAATAIHTALLRVNVPPRLSPFSFDEKLTEGMRTQVMCTTIAGDEPINMTWLKDTKEVQAPNHLSKNGIHVNYFSSFSTILTIPNITANHSGNYTCLVPPKWVVEPADQSVSVGSHVAIHCKAQGYPQPKITWKQAVGGADKREFIEVGYRTPAVLTGEDGLIISRVTKDHEAHYLCLANNGVGAGLSKLIKLTVNAAPRIRSRPQKEILKVGETVRLRCEAEGDEPIRISWVAKGINLNETKDSRFATIRNPPVQGSGTPSISELSIRDIALDDKGDFECFASNAFGQDSFRISVLVQERPQVPQNFRIIEHTSRTTVLSWSQPTVMDQDASVLDYILWFKEASEQWSEQTNKKSAPGDKTSLTVTGLSPAVTYDFRLFARNQLGMSDSSEVLQVRTDGEPPGGPPLHVSVEATSSTEIRASWQPPAKEYRHGEILGYNVGLRKAREDGEGFNWTKVGSSQDPVLNKALKGLEKYAEYEVVISAFNEQGEGPQTQAFMVTTFEDVPSVPPSDLSCSSPSAHAVSVSWQPPSRKSSNGVVVSYRVVLEQVEEDGGFFNEFAELESRVSGTNTAFHGLSPFTNYSVQVAAATNVGDGALSDPLFCKTLETVPGAPAEIKAVQSSGDSVIISWLPPRNPNGRVTKYHLYLRLMDADGGREVRTLKKTLPPSTTTFEVSEVKRRDVYEVWVTAEGNPQVGEGARSQVIKYPQEGSTTVSSDGNIPAEIVSFGRFLTVPWKTEVRMPCVAVGHPTPIVVWKKKETKTIDPNGNGKYEISGKENVLRIKSAQKSDSANNYTCFVKNPSGSAHITYTLIVQVPPSAPLLHPTSVTATAVRLQWKQGDNGGSSIRGFILTFRPSDGEWEEITLSRKLSTFHVQDLKCATNYEFFLSAFNKIGTGDQSLPVKLMTKGSRPILPTGYQFLEPSAMSIRISLSPWDPPDCPVTLFIIEYKVKGSSSSFTTLREERTDNKVITINELTPETEYIVRIRGTNGAGSTAGEYELSTSAFKGGLRSSSKGFNLSSGGPSSSSSSSKDNGGGSGGVLEDHPFYQDLHIILPLIISLFAALSATLTVLLWIRRKKGSTGMMESTTSLAYHRRSGEQDPFGGGRIDYMADRDYTVMRAKLMPECDYIPENADDIYPYATFHLPEKECSSLGEKVRDGFLGPPSSRLSNPEAIPIRQIPRGTVPRDLHNHGRRKSRTSLGNSGGGHGESGESEEYDDSCGSDSEALGDSNMNDSSRLKLTGTFEDNRRNNMFRNDETLLVSDRKSLPRGTRSKFSYGYSTTSNHPRFVGVGGVYSTPTTDRRDSETTSFIYGHQHQQHPLDHLSQMEMEMEMELNQMPVMECDNRIKNGGRNILGTGGRFLNNSQGLLYNNSPNQGSPKWASVSKGNNSQNNPNNPSSEYTIAV